MVLQSVFYALKISPVMREHFGMWMPKMLVFDSATMANRVKQQLAQLMVKANFCRQLEFKTVRLDDFLGYQIKQVTHQGQGIYAQFDIISAPQRVLRKWLYDRQIPFVLSAHEKPYLDELDAIAKQLANRYVSFNWLE